MVKPHPKPFQIIQRFLVVNRHYVSKVDTPMADTTTADYQVMQVYKNETQIAVTHFLGNRFNFAECIAALDAALAGLLPTLKREQLSEVQEVMLANHE